MGALGELGEKVRFSGAAVWIAATRPNELFDRRAGRREQQRQGPRGQVEPNRTDAAVAVHELLELPSCTQCDGELGAIDDEVAERLGERHRHDGGLALARMLWMVVRHTRPEKVVETGVARGVSSAYVLDALERNGTGRLWSIDLPPVRPGWHVEVGSAVPDRLRSRWTYVRGSSRRELPPLLDELGQVQLFVHDGLHTAETMAFEFGAVWPHLAGGGVLLADDVDANLAFVDFAQRVDRKPLLVGEQVKDGVVGLVRR